MASLHERLKELRIKSGYKQDDLARILEITPRMYRRYEEGANEPSINFLIIIADFYLEPLDYLVGRTDNNEDFEATLREKRDMESYAAYSRSKGFKEIAPRIRAARKIKGMTKTQLKELLSLPHGSITALENGLFDSIDPETAAKLAEFINVPEESLSHLVRERGKDNESP